MRTKIIKINPNNPKISQIRKAVEIIKSGGIVAFPTETVYGLGANAIDKTAVRKIFAAKGRPSDNPLIVHISDIAELGILVDYIPKIAFDLMDRFWPGPLTLVLKKSKIVPKIVTGGLDTVAVRMPKNAIARMLIKESGVPIAAPSANVAGSPSSTTAQHVIEDLSGKLSIILDGGPTKIGIESTVIDLSRKTPMLLRPGGVTLEQLQKLVGKIAIHPAVYGKKTKSAHRSPGMKYRHYSPRAKIILVQGAKANQKITQLVKFYKKQGLRVGVLSTKRNNSKFDMTRFIGASPDRIAANLFKAFREFDAEKIDIILVQEISQKGLGLGIMNRLRKAAYKKVRT